MHDPDHDWHSSFDPMLTRKISFDAIAGVLRLSTFYQIAPLRHKALALLSSVYPTSLPDFTDNGLGPSYCRDQILPVIQLARAYNLDWILPLAFYRFCLEMTGRNLVYGVEYAGARVVLSPADQALCFDARGTMCEANNAAILARFQARFKSVSEAGFCTGGEACRVSRFREADTLLQAVGALPDLVRHWEPEASSNLCPACLGDMREWHRSERQAGWDGLPGLFRLPDWTVLNKMKRVALGEEEEDNAEEDEEDVTF
jgi:hypothetical protein